MHKFSYILLIIFISCSSAPQIRYDGQFTEEGVYDGTGKITFSNDESWYGEFQNGVPYNGKGILYFYPGKFIKGVKNGDGEYYFPKGDKYIGEIKNGQKTGKGLLFFFVDQSSYDGFFEDDKRNGKGTITFMNGSSYEGNWKDDLADGPGKIHFINGEMYEGEWKENYAHGKGKYVTVDGIVYSGMFIEGKINYSGEVRYTADQDFTQEGELFYRHGIDIEPISLLRDELFEKN